MATIAPHPIERRSARAQRFGTVLLLVCAALVALSGCTKRSVAPAVKVIEHRQPSINDDPAVNGTFPTGFTIPTLPDAPIRAGKGAPAWNNHVAHPPVVEEDLPAGATRQIELQVEGPAALMGLARWIGTASSLPLSLSMDGTKLAEGEVYTTAAGRGGSDVRAKTSAGGRATLSVTNTTAATVKVQIILGAVPLQEQ
jgi:hypothetical protein